MRSELKLAILLVVVAGCADTNAFHYFYAGRLLDPQGDAAANVELYVTDRKGLEYFHGKYFPGDPIVQDHDFWVYWGTRTDENGCFHGTFNGDETYSKWLGVVPPVSPPAKTLDAVYVVVHRRDEWVPILVPLELSMQPHGHDGSRQIDLPPVMIPAGK
jgi:hypothetical protein